MTIDRGQMYANANDVYHSSLFLCMLGECVSKLGDRVRQAPYALYQVASFLFFSFMIMFHKTTTPFCTNVIKNELGRRIATLKLLRQLQEMLKRRERIEIFCQQAMEK